MLELYSFIIYRGDIKRTEVNFGVMTKKGKEGDLNEKQKGIGNRWCGVHRVASM